MPPADLGELLEQLVNILSVTGAEGPIADFVAARLRAAPAVAAGRGELLRSGHAVIWRARPAGRPLLVLAGHLDTVPPQDNGTARRRDGRLYGLGASDMKGGVAVMLGLAETLDPARSRYDVALVFYDAEEGPHAGNGLKRLLDELPWLREAALAVLLEPTELAMEMGCSGAMNVEVTVPGKSAHSARPWLGVNAVERAAAWLAEVTRFPTTPHRVSGVEYRETLQVTTLAAGRARNVVPDRLTANLNYRFPPDRTVADAERRVRELVPPEFEFRLVDAAAPGLVCSEDPAVKEFRALTGAAVLGKQGWTDVAQFTAAGVPAFNYGPGLPEQAHQREEFAPLDLLEPCRRSLATFLGGESA